MRVTLPEDVYQTRDGRLVPAGDPAGAALFARRGDAVSAATLARFGYEAKPATAATKPAPPPARKGGAR